MVQLYTYEEVSKHNTLDDLYIIIKSKVYDITKFVHEHPGGDELLLDEGAKDSTEAFEDVGHSPDACAILEQYYIGEVDIKSKAATSTKPQTKQVTAKESAGNPFRIIIPIIFFTGYFYWRIFIHGAN
ncbi:cytochrome b5 [Pilobolus umbonatus]|nr:cytochrome b5 [Pilobolus umbonatus]